MVVETNFRLYAYSTSKLHCEILRLFSRYASQSHNKNAEIIEKKVNLNAKPYLIHYLVKGLINLLWQDLLEKA